MEKPSLMEAFSDASAVFTGKVTNTRTLSENTRATVEIITAYKGTVSGTRNVFTERSDPYGALKYGISCGYPFKEGETYLIFAFTLKQSPLKTDSCGYTKPLLEAKETLEWLEKVKSE